MSLQQFVSQMRKYDVARPNQYKFRISIPKAFASGPLSSGLDMAYTSTLTLLCANVLVPAKRVMSSSGSMGNRPGKDTPYDLYGDVVDFTASFYIDSDYFVRDFFDRWMEAIDSSTTFEAGYFDDIVSPAVYVQAQNRGERTMYEYNFFHAFPQTIGATSYEYDSDSKMLLLPVAFRASYMSSEKKLTIGPIDL